MKKYLPVVIVMAIMSAFSWSQEKQTSPDAEKSGDEIRLMTGDRWIQTEAFPHAKKSGDEIEIMRGILNSTLKLYASSTSIVNRFDISSFYLRGQGAVFAISTAGLRDYYPAFATRTGSFSAVDSPALRGMSQANGASDSTPDNQALAAPPDDISQPVYMPRTSVRARNYRMETLDDGSVLTYLGGDEKKNISVTVPAANGKVNAAVISISSSADENGEAQINHRLESIGMAPESIAKFKKMVEGWLEEDVASWQKLLQAIDKIQTPLIDTLANYGDSLTVVKPEEYINLVLMTDESTSLQKKRLDIISARKSWITDYKAGRLTLDEFRQQVLQYNQ